MSHTQTATEVRLALRSKGFRSRLYDVVVTRDGVGIWRVVSIKERNGLYDWFPAVGKIALQANFMHSEDQIAWRSALRDPRRTSSDSGIDNFYSDLLEKNVRAVILRERTLERTGKTDAAEDRPRVDDIVRIEFRPATGSNQTFATIPVVENLVVETVG